MRIPRVVSCFQLTPSRGMGFFFLAFCVAFALSSSDAAARRVLLVSVFYLPAVLAVMVLDRVI